MIENEFTFEPYDFSSTEVLGVPLHVKHLSFAPCVHIRILFNYGAMHDELGKEGTAHFLEHMLFKGNDIYADEKAVRNFSKDILLGTHNAHTNIFELVIKGKCLPHNFEKAIGGLFSMVHSSKLTEEAWAQEKSVITQEAWRRYLNETHIQYVKKTRINKLSNLPDRVRIVSALGWPDTIQNINHADIVAAYKKYFVKENMEIYLAGNIETVGTIEEVKDILTRSVTRVPSGEKARLPFVPEVVQSPLESRIDYTYTNAGLSEKNQTDLSIQYRFARLDKKAGRPTTAKEKFFTATAVMAAKLVSDIIYEKLRVEQSWCYSASAGFYTDVDFYQFNIATQINPLHVEDAIEISKTLIEDIKKGIYAERFEQRKRLALEAIMARENLTGDIVDEVVDDTVTHNSIITRRQGLDELEKVKFEDVVQMVSTELTTERLLIEILRPSGKK